MSLGYGRQDGAGELQKKPSIRLSQEPCLGVKVVLKRPGGWVSSQARVSSKCVRNDLAEDQLDRGAGRIGGIEKLEELTNSRLRWRSPTSAVDLAGEQIDPGQQVERAMGVCTHDPARSSGMAAWHWRNWCRRGDGLDLGFSS